MKRSYSLLFAILFSVLAAWSAPQAPVGQAAPAPGVPPVPAILPPPFVQDTRPFGKYLVEVCSFSAPVGSPMPLMCNAPQPVDNSGSPLRPQTITVKVACGADSTKSCGSGNYPLAVGDTFFIRATSEVAAPPVNQTVVTLNGAADGPNTGGLQQYHVTGPGPVIVRAMQSAHNDYAAATPVEVALSVKDMDSTAGGDPSDATCNGLFSAAKPGAAASDVDLAHIVSLIGNPVPFVLTAEGNNTIFIYSTRNPEPLVGPEQDLLNSLPSKILFLAQQNAAYLGIPAAGKAFSVELRVPHAAALGDLATRISALNYSQFTVLDIGSDAVRITASAQPECAVWTAFLASVRRMEWQVKPEPFEMKLFYLSSSDAAAAFTTLTTSSAPSGGGAPSTGGGTQNSGSPGATPAAANSPSSPASANGNATVSVSQPPGSFIEIKSDTVPCVALGLTMGNSSACTGSPSGGAAAGSGNGNAGSSAPVSPAAKPPAPTMSMASMAVAAGATEQVPSDLLVFSASNPGDDALVTERKRIIAELDLPRPEMIINAWVMQNSTSDPRAMGEFAGTIREMVEGYNQATEKVVTLAWQFVQGRTQHDNYFNPNFYHYIADRYIADTYQSSPPKDAQDAAQRFLDSSPVQLADGSNDDRDKFGICHKEEYCLGFSTLFQPLKPHLTDVLLTLMAAQWPELEIEHTIDCVERSAGDGKTSVDPCDPNTPPCDCGTQTASAATNRATATESCANCAGKPPTAESAATCLLGARVKGASQANDGKSGKAGAGTENPANGESRKGEFPERCSAIRSNIGLSGRIVNTGACATSDYKDVIDSLPEGGAPHVYLNCFREEVRKLFPKGVGSFRSAIADFLFNYKWSQQYPHEFTSYDLSQSADALNSALNPLVDAFNQDIVAYQAVMHADVQYQVDRLNDRFDRRCCVKKLFGVAKPSFFNDGIVSVRTISGQLTSVLTTSQSAVDASAAPSLSALLNSIGAGGAGSGGASGTSPLASALGASQAPVSLLSGLLNAYQSTTAQIGRELNLIVTPRSLSTASAAELAVSLDADETANGPTYSGGPAGGTQPNTSRVAQHDVTTRIRVDSIKLFELSSFSAILQRSRSKFPLVPPFVEIPYIGSVLGVPIPNAKEYHASTAMISALVVPTAADIAYGLKFSWDQVLDGDTPGLCSFLPGSAGPDVANACRLRRAVSIHDLDGEPIRNFHRAMIHCFATDMKSPYSSIRNLVPEKSNGVCSELSFRSVPGEY